MIFSHKLPNFTPRGSCSSLPADENLGEGVSVEINSINKGKHQKKVATVGYTFPRYLSHLRSWGRHCLGTGSSSWTPRRSVPGSGSGGVHSQFWPPF